LHRIEELVHSLQHIHQDHRSRVGQEGVDDLTGNVLQEILTLQSSLPSSDDETLLFGVSRGMAEQWAIDIEELETALGAPFHPTSPAPVRAEDSQMVCSRLMESLLQLQSEMPFMQQLLLAKKLLCVDQLRPSVDDHPPYQSLELRALLMRLAAHDCLWSFALRLPWSYLTASKGKMKQRAASFYAKAAKAAAPNVLQQARLLVEQCKVLDSDELLHHAKRLHSISLEYPEAPLMLLHQLHTQYPAAGPPLDRSLMQQFDAEVSEWRTSVGQAQLRASDLEQRVQLGSSDADPAAAQQARMEADELSTASPRSFAQCMNKSRMFFHTDKRQHDQTASAEEKAAQFSQVNEAWDCLSACRMRFQELRDFRAKAAAAAVSS